MMKNTYAFPGTCCLNLRHVPGLWRQSLVHSCTLPYHLATLPPCQLATLPPCHLATLSRGHLATLSRCHLTTLPLCHLISLPLQPCHLDRSGATTFHFAARPSLQATLEVRLSTARDKFGLNLAGAKNNPDK